MPRDVRRTGTPLGIIAKLRSHHRTRPAARRRRADLGRGGRAKAQPSFGQRIAAFLRPAIAVPIAAVLVAGAFFGYTATHHNGPITTIDAAYYLRDHASLNGTMPFGEGSVDPSLRGDESAGDQQWIASTGTSVVAETR